MADFEINTDSSESRIDSAENDSLKIRNMTIALSSILLGIFTVYLVYTIMYLNKNTNQVIELTSTSATDTLYNTMMTTFADFTNYLFIATFFGLGILFVMMQKYHPKKRKAALITSGIMAMLSIVFVVIAIIIINFRSYAIDSDTSLNFLEKIIAKLNDDLLIAMIPTANLVRFLFIAIAIVIFGFVLKGMNRKEKFKQRAMITPIFFLLGILLWAALLVTDYLLLVDSGYVVTEQIANLFLATNITQVAFASTGVITSTELVIQLTRIN